MVLYFSGTGNSKYVAEQLSLITNNKIVSINNILKSGDNSPITVDGDLIIVTPTYAWQMPRVVRDRILSIDFVNVKRVWFVMTCGSEIGNSAKYNKALCNKKGFEYMGTAQVVMPENYIIMFNSPPKDEIKGIINKANIVINEIGNKIAKGEVLESPKNNLQYALMSSMVNSMFYPMFVSAKGFYAKENCTGCGKCVSVCPLNNVRLNNKKPEWSNNCTHCLACLSYCPTGAVEYGKKTLNKSPYHFENDDI